MSRYSFKVEDSEMITELTVTGSIDETFTTNSLNINQSKPLVINVKDVKLISSNGTRAWINFMNSLKNTTITFIQCSKVFIDQINATHGFCPVNAKVLSFYAPYFNKAANVEKSVLFTYGKDFKNNEITAPKEITGEDGTVYTLDVNESKYFKFIKQGNSL